MKKRRTKRRNRKVKMKKKKKKRRNKQSTASLRQAYRIRSDVVVDAVVNCRC